MVYLPVQLLSRANKSPTSHCEKSPGNIITEKVTKCNASVNSKRQHPPRGNFFEVVKSPARSKIFLQKHGSRAEKAPTPGNISEDSQPFLFIGVEISEFYRNQTSTKLEVSPTILWSYPLVSV